MKKNQIYDISEALNIFSLGDGFAVGKDGSMTIGFTVQLPEVKTLLAEDFCKDPDRPREGKDFNSLLISAISNLDANYTFHQQDIIFYNKPNLPQKDFYLQKYIRQANEKEYLDCKTYIFISSPPTGGINDSTFKSSRVNSFVEKVKSFQNSLFIFSPKQMDNEDWLFYLDSFFSCDFSSKNNKTPLDISFLNNTIGDYNLSGYSVRCDKNISHNDIQVRQTNNVKGTTRTDYSSWVSPICWDVPCYKILNNVIKLADKESFQSSLREYSGRLGLLSTIGDYSSAAESFALFLDKNEQAIPIYHNFSTYFLYENTQRKTIENKISSVIDTLKFKESKVTINLEYLFCSSLGGCATKLSYPDELYPALLNEAVCFSNLENNNTHFSKGIVVRTKNNVPVLLDIFDEPKQRGWITNQNILGFGPSGSGKSYTFNLLINGWIELNYLVVVIDIGNSYRNQTLLWQQTKNNARYITLDGAKGLSFNPFLIPMLDPNNIVDDEIKTDFFAELEMLVDTIFLAWFDDSQTPNVNQKQTMYNYVKAFYKRRYDRGEEFVSFTAFYNFIQDLKAEKKINPDYFDLASFELVMNKFCDGEEYGFLFNGKENLINDVHQLNLVAFELGKLEARPLLYKLTLVQIMIISKRIIAKANNPRQIFLFDEAWRLLDNLWFSPFIKYMYKTIRKTGSVCMLVQDFTDIINYAAGQSLITNSGIIVIPSFLGQREQLTQYAPNMKWTQSTVNRLTSLDNAEHEVAFVWGDEMGIYKMATNAAQNFLYTTDKEEKPLRDNYITNCNGDMMFAITKYLEDVKNNKNPF